MKKLLLILILTILAVPSFAVDNDGNYAIWGLGKKSCFAYNKENANGETQNYKSYMKGFLTAYNIFTEHTYSITGKMTEQEITEWLHEYCADNPMSSLENALVSFTFDHYDKRLKSTGKSVGR